MTVIKQTQTRAAMKEAVVLDLGDLGRQAARLRMAAEARAARIVAVAEHQARQLIETASAEGFEQGRRAGYEQGLADGAGEGRAEALARVGEQLEKLQASWSAAVSRWDRDLELMHREARRSVLDFAVRVARRLVHRVIEVDRRVVVDQVGESLKLVLAPLQVRVKIHPDDHEVVDAALPKLIADLPQLDHVTLSTDEQVGRGGCVVLHGRGVIDARIENQIERVVELIAPDERSEVGDQKSESGSQGKSEDRNPKPDSIPKPEVRNPDTES